MSLRIEIVGDGDLARRMIRELRALKGFDVTSVGVGVHHAPPAVDRSRPPLTTIVEVEGRGDGRVVLHENPLTGDIEGLPVVVVPSRTEGA